VRRTQQSCAGYFNRYVQRNIVSKILSLALISIFVFGCSSSKLYQTPTGFIQLPTDSRVWYENGAREKAELISSVLDEKIKIIEESHYRPFKQEIRFYVFSSQDSYSKYSPQPKSGAESFGDKILISPKKKNTDSRIPGVVTHELSHYHLFGYLGLYQSRITPRWFIEGIAVWVSNGTGAEKAHKEDAIDKIIEGNHINPVTRHPLFFGENSHPPGMKTHMFYRQSALFVEYLNSLSSSNFKELIQGVEEGKSFSAVFEKAYGNKPATIWDQFTEDLAHNKSLNQIGAKNAPHG
jgi:hypothetical protein